MIKDFCINICNNKNLLMFVTVAFYIAALCSVFTNMQFLFALIVTIILSSLILSRLLPLKYILVWFLVFYLGIVNLSMRLKDTDALLNIAPVNSTIYGKIISIPQDKGDGKLKFFFDVKKIEYDSIVKEFDDEKVFVTINNTTDLKLKNYERYKLTGRLSLPFKAGNPSQFDYGNYLRNFGTYSVFYVNDVSTDGNCNVEKLDENITKKEKFLQGVNDYRENIIHIHSNYLKSPNLEILGGIVFGDDAVSTPENIKQSFINSGLLHILAASGMNVAFIFSFFYFFLSLFRINHKVNIVVCIFMILLYLLMTGLGPSVIRAAFMLVFVLIGKLIDRDAHSISLLAFVALLMLIYNPMYLNDVGFQLSFVVTFGLLLTTPYLIRSKYKILNWIIGTITIPIIAQLWVIPIQIFYFNNISLYSVLANIMSVPMLSIISFGGFISSLLSLISPIADFVCHSFDFILNPLISGLVFISEFWGKMPHSSLQTSHPSVLQVMIYYGILWNLTFVLDKEVFEKYKKFLLISLPVLILILCVSIIPLNNHNLEITAFDVGNADAFLIKTPNDKYLMIDTAKNGYNGGKSQAEVVIVKYLKDKGIKNIDSIIVTHFDNDHCGGAVDLMKNLNVKKLYVNDLNHPSIAAGEIYETARDKKVELIKAQNKQSVYDESGLKITNYLPKSKSLDDNQNSIFTVLEYNDFKMLFTGDGGENSFEEIKSNLPKGITVLKVGHHGGLGSVSRSMLEYLNPEYALISVGENKFGHPNLVTIDRLHKSKILRTDIDNSIKFVVNKKGTKVYCYNMKFKKYRQRNS